MGKQKLFSEHPVCQRLSLEAGESQAALVAIRHNTHTGRPLGSAEFLRAVEGQTKRRLALQKRGPKRAAEPGKSQGTFSFGA